MYFSSLALNQQTKIHLIIRRRENRVEEDRKRENEGKKEREVERNDPHVTYYGGYASSSIQ